MASTSEESGQRSPTDLPPAADIEYLDSTSGAAMDKSPIGEMSKANISAPVQKFQCKPLEKSTIVVKTHDGHGYVLPYLPWEITQPQIEQIYRLRSQGSLADAVKDGNIRILDENGNIILPELWEQVVKPNATLKIDVDSDVLESELVSRYTYLEEAADRHRRRSRSVVLPEQNAASQDVLDVVDSAPNDTDDGSGSNEDSDFESVSSGSERPDSPARERIPDDPLRQVTMPTDCDGNDLVFQVNTALVGPRYQALANVDANDRPKKRDAQKSTKNSECLSITKAISTQSDGRTSLQVHVLPGPRTAFTDTDVSVRWFHLCSDRLDFASFKQSCLGITGLSERLQKLVGRLLDKVEREKLKISLGGMFIEPGTVLRADESHQADPQSAIFSCIPYFNLQVPAKSSPTTANLVSSRTLMQSYYPYEPVQARDEEQAYRLFGNERHGALVHVPSIWMLNIGVGVVFTCGHQALAKDFVQSIEVIETSCLQGNKQKDPPSTIRLRDWNDRKLLYTVEECRSFFQMEQKLKELRRCSSRSLSKESNHINWITPTGIVKVLPGLWPDIVNSRGGLFIDLIVSSDGSDEGIQDSHWQTPFKRESSSLPFFRWPQSTQTGKTKTDDPALDGIQRCIECLGNVEKAMLSEVLSRFGVYNVVERTFTTTFYYRGLPEETTENVKIRLQSLLKMAGKMMKPTTDGTTTHEALVARQRNSIGTKTIELNEIMHRTLALFAGNVDKTTMLRKAWGAMKSIGDLAITSCKRSPVSDDTAASGDGRHPQISRGWFVRPVIDDIKVSASLGKAKRMFERCKKCNSDVMYGTSDAALLHLNKHLQRIDPAVLGYVRPEQWIASYSQKELETWNEGTVEILTVACRTAQLLLTQAEELSDGVLNEDGRMSALYVLPRPLLSAFRQVLVFYFSVERSLYHAEESWKDKRKVIESPEYMQALPFSVEGLQAVESFGYGAQRELTAAREELCAMVKSTGPVEIFKRLSLSPEYVCGWFMRRLLVKPLEKSMTVSDMYREYLSTIQFQVNHRPGKRLLRSINLLQEELAALQEVNTQQNKLISNYMSVLDDMTYEKDAPSRRAMFPYERMLLESCQESLRMTDQEYRYLLARCGPLSDSTKQSLEINEEDHGKAIMVFTIVTVIFLPLSFVTSFLGMNTTDIRDMGSSSTLFWAVAIPLTAVTMGSVLYIGYNGDDLRDALGSLYRTVTGKQNRSTNARGISVAQRKLAHMSATNSNSTLDFSSLADEAEFADPRPDDPRRQVPHDAPAMHWESYTRAAKPLIPEPRTGLRTEPLTEDAFYGRRTSEFFNPEPSDEVEAAMKLRLARSRHATSRGERHTVLRYPSPPPAPPPPLRQRNWDLEDDWYRGQPPRERSRDRDDVRLFQYEWTKRSHRQHHAGGTQQGTRRRRQDQNEWRGT